jgi:hypothetical protein
MVHWDPIELLPGQTHGVTIGPLHLWVRRTKYEWRIAWAGNEAPATLWTGVAGDEPPEGVAWNRWAASPDQTRLHLIPVLADRPLVIRPDTSFRIPPGVKVRIYVQVPVWVRLTLGDKTTLTEVPTVHLSNTWFGEPDAGELAWALKTDVHHAVEEVPLADHEAICRVDINHKGKEQLELNRLFLRAAHLRVYRTTERLWTNGVKAVYEGGERVGSVDYLKSAPSEAKGAGKASDERERADGPLVRAKAGLLRSIERDTARAGEEG